MRVGPIHSNLMEKLRVDIWSDIACPWCYVGKRRLEGALAQLPERDAVDITWRAFELDPSAPRRRDTNGSYAERLARKYGCSVEQAREMICRMTDIAAAEGLPFDFDRIKPGNTFDAHRVIHLAAERGKQDAVKERLLRGYLVEGEPIGEPEAIARLVTDAGLDADEVQGVLHGDAYAREVRADEEQARALGISGVPFFVLAGRYGISGAQPVETFLSALRTAMATPDEGDVDEGATCGPDGCSV